MSRIPISQILANSSTVTDLINVEKQVFEDVAPENTPQPYVVWQALGDAANENLDCPANFDDVMYQVMVYAADVKIAYQIRDVVRRAIEQDNHTRILNPSINDFDFQTRLYVRGFDANWILER